MKMREGDTLRIGGRLGRVYRDDHGDTVYKHRRGPDVSAHPQQEALSGDLDNPGGFIDWIWSAPILKLVVFIGAIFLCMFPGHVIRFFIEMVA